MELGRGNFLQRVNRRGNQGEFFFHSGPIRIARPLKSLILGGSVREDSLEKKGKSRTIGSNPETWHPGLEPSCLAMGTQILRVVHSGE